MLIYIILFVLFILFIDYIFFFLFFFFFFFQAEDGIRDIGVTGVQTCALPILQRHRDARDRERAAHRRRGRRRVRDQRSEEHTSELQSRQYLVCRLLLEKKKKGAPGRRDAWPLSPPRDAHTSDRWYHRRSRRQS